MKINCDNAPQKEHFNRKKAVKSFFKTKIDLKEGRVIFLSPQSVHVTCQEKDYYCAIKGTLKKELKQNKDRICPGDLVHFDPQKNMIVRVIERKTALLRQNPTYKQKEQILAANIDLLLITTSLKKPDFNPFLVDLYVLSAKRYGLKPVILINKMDLLDPNDSKSLELLETIQNQYKRLGISVILVSAKTKQGFEQLKELMAKNASVFSGASGVGKSSLINALHQRNLKVSSVSEKNSKGVHTTTSSQLLKIPSGGFCVDTPGVQSLGFKNLKPIDIRNLFEDLTDIGCQFHNCLHQGEMGCVIDQAIAKKEVSKLRLNSYHRLLKEESQKV